MAKDDIQSPWTWASGGQGLTPAPTTTPATKGDITAVGPTPRDPDQLVGPGAGGITFSPAASSLVPGVAAPKKARGDLTTDAQFNPGSKAIPNTFASGGTPLVPGAFTTPQKGQGDIMLTYEGADGQKQTVFGEITWATGGLALIPGVTTHNPGKGDITGDYGKTELWQEIATWAAGGLALVPGTLPVPTGKGDFPDPNTWQDLTIFRTSQLYPLLFVDHMSEATTTPDSTAYQYTEHMQEGGFIFGTGILYLGLVTYSNWPIEHMQETASFSSGSLTVPTPPHIYSNWPAEHMQESASTTGGTLYLGLITYSNWPAEHLQESASFTGGTLV